MDNQPPKSSRSLECSKTGLDPILDEFLSWGSAVSPSSSHSLIRLPYLVVQIAASLCLKPTIPLTDPHLSCWVYALIQLWRSHSPTDPLFSSFASNKETLFGWELSRVTWIHLLKTSASGKWCFGVGLARESVCGNSIVILLSLMCLSHIEQI